MEPLRNSCARLLMPSPAQRLLAQHNYAPLGSQQALVSLMIVPEKGLMKHAQLHVERVIPELLKRSRVSLPMRSLVHLLCARRKYVALGSQSALGLLTIATTKRLVKNAPHLV
jgi:hypothetical protein